MSEVVGSVAAAAGVAAAIEAAAKIYSKYKKKGEKESREVLENLRECLRIFLPKLEGEVHENQVLELLEKGFEKVHETSVHIKGGPRINRTVRFGVAKEKRTG